MRQLLLCRICLQEGYNPLEEILKIFSERHSNQLQWVGTQIILACFRENYSSYLHHSSHSFIASSAKKSGTADVILMSYWLFCTLTILSFPCPGAIVKLCFAVLQMPHNCFPLFVGIIVSACVQWAPGARFHLWEVRSLGIPTGPILTNSPLLKSDNHYRITLYY